MNDPPAPAADITAARPRPGCLEAARPRLARKPGVHSLNLPLAEALSAWAAARGRAGHPGLHDPPAERFRPIGLLQGAAGDSLGGYPRLAGRVVARERPVTPSGLLPPANRRIPVLIPMSCLGLTAI
jgi:hypothetical protein